ncbi:hypothetical protein A3841_13485 [Pontibacter flavimaris]|uniref:Uncharacterized protein n=1 Tax=Pontibacter flavimaris TaxID=1797110 RepID=A0A1Q5PF53_9BACT|nr:hypothetical protein A3841_13485 [Pontibacter flavimaris]
MSMALFLHITLALCFYVLYSRALRLPFERFMGTPSNAADWVWVYLKALLLSVLVPYVCAELILMSLLDRSAWDYNRTIMLLPHFASLLSDRRISRLLRAVLKV